MSGTQVLMTGFSLSFTVTVKVQALVLSLVSVAVQVTVFTPFLKLEPLGGLQTTEAMAQLSLAVGVVQVATAVQRPESVDRVILLGQAMPGAWISLTVTVKLQLLT